MKTIKQTELTEKEYKLLKTLLSSHLKSKLSDTDFSIAVSLCDALKVKEYKDVKQED